jgi:type I restriction enzyme, S subunit
MNEQMKTPQTWEVIRTGEIGDLLRGVSYKKEYSSNEQLNNYLPVLRANNINGELNFKDLVYVHNKYINDKQFLKKGDIVFAMSSGSKHLVGKSAKAKNDFEGSYGAFCAVFRPYDEVNKDLIAYYFQAPEYKKLISSISKGTNINNLKREHILGLEFPLPPLLEQHRIVAKIEEQFSSLDKGIESLKTAQVQLKTYRQAVLKWAFEGKLTNENVKDGELPEGWKEEPVSKIAETFGGYAFKSGDFIQNGKYQVLRMGNIRPGVLRYEESPVFVDYTDDSVLKRALLKINDIIITQTGTKGKRDYGFTVLIPKTNLLLNQRIAAIRCTEKCLPKFLLYFTWTDKFKNQFFANETGNVGQGNVGMRAVTGTIIVIPPLPEQQAIVSEIETRLSVCDKLEESISQSLAQAEALRQSILKKAFEGKLAPQDPNDEPASVLLERIRAERNNQAANQLNIKNKRKSKP